MSVALSRVDEYALITLNRPDVLNALSFSVLRELEQAFDDVAASDARGLIVTGAGSKAFCAGADIRELLDRALIEQKRGAELGQQIFARLDRLGIPSVAAMNGYAFGGGLELAMSCTFRIAADTAKFGLPEIKLGLIPGYGGTQRLPRLVGEARALEIIMSGRTIDAEEAERIGLVNRLVAGDPVEPAAAFLRSITRFSLPVLSFAREAVARALTVPLSEGLRIEANLATLAFRTEDSREGMNAFLGKRQPTFQDR